MALFDSLPESDDAYSLYEFVRRQVACLPAPPEFADRVITEFSSVWESPISNHIRQHYHQFVAELYAFEQYDAIPPLPSDLSNTTLEGARYRDELIAKIFHIGEPHSATSVLQNIGTMILTHVSDLLREPYNEEVYAPDFWIPVIHRLHSIPEFIDFLLHFFSGERIVRSAHIFPRLRARLTENNTQSAIKLRAQAEREFGISPVDVVTSAFSGTPFMRLFELKLPIKIPADFKAEHPKVPLDPDHPKYYCYQCKRRLPADFAQAPWQEIDFPKGPFFHTERCRSTTLNRHRAADGSYVETYRSMLKEYNIFVRDYEHKKRMTDEEKQRKEQEQFDRAYLRAHEDHERFLEKEQKTREAEEARKAEEDRWTPRLFKP